MNKTGPTTRERLLENVAAISANVHQSSAYQAFYDAHGAALNGFPGIWQYCVEAGEAFTRAEGRIFWDGEYIEAIDAFTAALLATGPMTATELYHAAARAIVEALTANGQTPPARLTRS
jgi:hypothetical protein